MALKQDILPRKYQKEIAESVLRKGNSLIVLPTGLGKTLIGILIADALKDKGSVLFLAPTKPLVNQHTKSFEESIENADVISLTGDIPKAKRKKLWNRHNIIIATPQTVASDIDYIDKSRFSLVVFDEVHRAVGKYAYSLIAEQFKRYAMLVGLTASPGGKKIKIDEIKKTLGIINVESRDYEDEDVSKYVKQMDIEWIAVEQYPEYRKLAAQLNKLTKWYLKMVRGYGFRVGSTRKKMIGARSSILRSSIKSKYHAIKYLSAAINIDYAAEMIETQSIDAFLEYVKNLKTREGKGIQILLKDGRFEQVVHEAETHKVLHPKMNALINILNQNASAKYIIFSQYTAQINHIENVLQQNGFKCKKFIGQRKGFTRKKQLEVIKQFREEKFNILIASSIGEEGLDIPSVDYVIFYEPIPSEIRTIQRRGRAGRAKKGYVRILITKGTRDEAYYFVSKRKEKKMKKIIKDIGDSSEQKVVKDKPIKRSGTLLDYM